VPIVVELGEVMMRDRPQLFYLLGQLEARLTLRNEFYMVDPLIRQLVHRILNMLPLIQGNVNRYETSLITEEEFKRLFVGDKALIRELHKSTQVLDEDDFVIPLKSSGDELSDLIGQLTNAFTLGEILSYVEKYALSDIENMLIPYADAKRSGEDRIDEHNRENFNKAIANNPAFSLMVDQMARNAEAKPAPISNEDSN